MKVNMWLLKLNPSTLKTQAATHMLASPIHSALLDTDLDTVLDTATAPVLHIHLETLADSLYLKTQETVQQLLRPSTQVETSSTVTITPILIAIQILKAKFLPIDQANTPTTIMTTATAMDSDTVTMDTVTVTMDTVLAMDMVTVTTASDTVTMAMVTTTIMIMIQLLSTTTKTITLTMSHAITPRPEKDTNTDMNTSPPTPQLMSMHTKSPST